MYSPQQIAEVQQAVDIVEVISTFVPLRRRGKDYLALCPFHQEKTPSFSVSPSKQIFKCFGCGVGGDVITFLMRHEKMSFTEAVEYLADRAGIRLERRSGGGSARTPLYEVCRWAAEEYRRQLVATPRGRRALDYLLERGLDRRTIDRFRLGYAPEGWDSLVSRAGERFSGKLLEEAGLVQRRPGGGFYDRFRNRVIFPITDLRGRPIAFAGRTLAEEGPKYLNSPDTPLFNKSRCLYGLAEAKEEITRRRRVCVVEGYLDCLMAHRQGVGWVVATMGTALSVGHLDLLRRYAETAVLVFDGDQAGRAATERALELFLSQELEVEVCILPEGLDPCDFLVGRGAEAFERVLASAEPAIEFKLRDLERRYDLDRPQDKRRAIDEVLRLLARLPSRTRSRWAIRRDLALARLASRVGVSEQSLRWRLAQLAGVGRRGGSLPSPLPPIEPRRQLERELVEILVCRSDLAEEVRGILPPEEMRDRDLATIAERVCAAAGGSRRLALREVLALVAEVGLGGKVADLAAAGEAKGRFEERLEHLRQRLAEQRRRQRLAQLREQLARQPNPEKRTALLRELDRLLRQGESETEARRCP